MELLFKVKNKYAKIHPNYLKGWKDGQLIDIRPDGFHQLTAQSLERKSHMILRTQHDFWNMRGTPNTKQGWKSTIGKVYDLKKWMSPVDSNGRYDWEQFYLDDEKRLRARDWFVDFKDWLDKGWITQAQFDSIYNPAINHNDIYFDRNINSYLIHEDIGTRKPSIYSELVNSPEFIASGTYSIGSGLDYSTVTAFEAAIDATLTGNLTGEHNDEETSISAAVVFDIDTATYLLKLTAQAGDEHDGTGYGNGARVLFGTSDALTFDEASANTLDNAEVSNLALDITGAANKGLRMNDGGVGGLFTVNRMLMEGNVDTHWGIEVRSGCLTITITNCIISNCGEQAGEFGIGMTSVESGRVYTMYNNTCIKNYDNFNMEDVDMPGTMTFKNNLAQGAANEDYADGGGGYGTTAKNYAQDTTSPDTLQETFHDGTSNFVDYANDNYLMASGGDAIDTLKAGEDLTGTFTDDIIDNTRIAASFFIGASWISVVTTLSINVSDCLSTEESLV